MFNVPFVIDRAVNKGNNKITELRAIFQKGKSKLISIKTDKINQQPENCVKIFCMVSVDLTTSRTNLHLY